MGFSKAFSYRARREELENTLELVRILNLEISYRKDSLKKTFERVSGMKKAGLQRCLKAAVNILKKAGA